MWHPAVSVLRGSPGSPLRAGMVVTLALVVFAVSFAAYATGVFFVSGGVVFIPYYAALVGLVAAVGVGLARGGLVAAWAVVFAALYGFHADHAFLGLSYRTFAAQVEYFVEPQSILVFAIEAILVGTLPFVVGRGGRHAADVVRTRRE